MACHARARHALRMPVPAGAECTHGTAALSLRYLAVRVSQRVGAQVELLGSSTAPGPTGDDAEQYKQTGFQ
eukprot:scaffold2427_cov226-Prasinococcus_capsulatus_cf.AAC.1